MALVERTEKTTDATNWQSGIPLNYRYTAGRAGEKFLTHVKEKGEFLATNCADCGVTYVPPTIYCERCLARIEDTFAPLPARGTVHAFTICHETYDGTRKDEPSIVALIRIDGSDGAFLSKWGSYGDGDGQFVNPCGVVVDGSGDLYVADTGNERIQKFDSTGTFVAQWGSSGSGAFLLPYHNTPIHMVKFNRNLFADQVVITVKHNWNIVSGKTL